MTNLAGLYQDRGRRFARTEMLLKQAAEGYRVKLGADHPRRIAALNNLGMLYLQLRRHAEAQPLFEQVLQRWTNEPGTEHPERLTLLHNLASVYHQRGRHQEAESLFRQALEGRRRLFGASHPGTLATMNKTTWPGCTRTVAGTRKHSGSCARGCGGREARSGPAIRTRAATSPTWCASTKPGARRTKPPAGARSWPGRRQSHESGR
jgi:hypothetical protein